MMLLASAGGNRVPVIAQLVQADEDTVRDVIHRFNEIGLAGLDPRTSASSRKLRREWTGQSLLSYPETGAPWACRSRSGPCGPAWRTRCPPLGAKCPHTGSPL